MGGSRGKRVNLGSITQSSRGDGPKKRIQGARKLWKTGDKENAAILIFVATAGISRIRYPLDTKDWEPFQKFIREEIATVTEGAISNAFTFPTDKWKLPDVVMDQFGVKKTKRLALEQIIYGVWRNVTIHEARWPEEVYLTKPRIDTKYSQTIELPNNGKIGLPEVWILGLANAVEYAVEIMLPKILRFPMYYLYSGPIQVCGLSNHQVIPGETKVASLKVRNQPATPMFTDQKIMNTFMGQNPGIQVGVLPCKNSLRKFAEHRGDECRFIFNPREGEKPLPSYSKASLLATIQQL